MPSIIIPAHDEERVIAETLSNLFSDAHPDEFEVIVACNGCRDRTADIARSFGPLVHVIEVPQAAKWEALNAGDRVTSTFPRVYLDADVLVRGADIRALVRTVEHGPWLAAALKPRFDLTGCSLAVRGVYALYRALPVVRNSLIGAGVYALSREGRRRFGAFPAVMSDDLFVSCHFTDAEMGKVTAGRSVVRPPRTLAGLVTTKTRAYVGAADLRRLGYPVPSAPATDWLRAVRSEPHLLGVVPVYVLTATLARVRARRRLRSGDVHVWDRDERSRLVR